MSLAELERVRSEWIYRYLRSDRALYSADENAAAWVLQHSSAALVTDLALLKCAVLRVEARMRAA